MVDRFLCWELPKDFAPDGGISFDHSSKPIGTNLLTADQARQMFEHVTAEDHKDLECQLAEANEHRHELQAANTGLRKQLAEAREISAARNAQVSAFEQYSNNLQRELEEERSTDDLEPSCGDCIYYNGEYCSGSPDRFGKNNDSPSCDGFEEKAND